MKRKTPTTGFWWVILDDGGYYTIDPVLVRVIVHDDNSLDAFWVDDSEKSFSMTTLTQEVVRLTLGVIWSANRDEYRVTWLAPAVPPSKSPAKNDPVPAEMAI